MSDSVWLAIMAPKVIQTILKKPAGAIMKKPSGAPIVEEVEHGVDANTEIVEADDTDKGMARFFAKALKDNKVSPV